MKISGYSADDSYKVLQNFMKIGWELTIGEKHAIQANLTGSIIRILTCYTDINNRRNLRVIIPQALYPLPPFWRNKICNHEWYELLTLRSVIILELSPVSLLWFYKINDVETHRKLENISRFPSVITLVVVRTTEKIFGPPDPLSWWSCGPLDIKVCVKPCWDHL